MTSLSYISTRGSAPRLSFDDVLLAGLARDGGLYVPETWPRLTPDEIAAFAGLPFSQIAVSIMDRFAGEAIARRDLSRMVEEPYATLGQAAATPLVQVNAETFILELFRVYKLPLKKVSLFICFSFTIGYLSGQSKQAYVNAGSRAMADGDYYSAGTFFSKALAFDATDHDLMLKMASASRLYNDYLGAANWYEKYLNAGEKIRDSSAIFYLA